MRFHPTKDLVITASGDQTCHLWQAAISPEQMVSNFVLLSFIDQYIGFRYLLRRYFIVFTAKGTFIGRRSGDIRERG